MTPGFQRARSEEQRAHRRESIIEAARSLLGTVRVEDLTLTALAERAGLAKSNVLRYFESREAVLIEIHRREYRAWLDDLDAALPPGPDADVDAVAAIFADTFMTRPRLQELAGYVPIVAEQTISAEFATAHKLAVGADAMRLAHIVGSRFGGWDPAASLLFIASIEAGTAGIWTVTQPPPGVAEAYAANPALAVQAHYMPFILREFVATVITDLANRPTVLPIPGAPGAPPPQTDAAAESTDDGTLGEDAPGSR